MPLVALPEGLGEAYAICSRSPEIKERALVKVVNFGEN